jgi:hypothetical protein
LCRDPFGRGIFVHSFFVLDEKVTRETFKNIDYQLQMRFIGFFATIVLVVMFCSTNTWAANPSTTPPFAMQTNQAIIHISDGRPQTRRLNDDTVTTVELEIQVFNILAFLRQGRIPSFTIETDAGPMTVQLIMGPTKFVWPRVPTELIAEWIKPQTGVLRETQKTFDERPPRSIRNVDGFEQGAGSSMQDLDPILIPRASEYTTVEEGENDDFPGGESEGGSRRRLLSVQEQQQQPQPQEEKEKKADKGEKKPIKTDGHASQQQTNPELIKHDESRQQTSKQFQRLQKDIARVYYTMLEKKHNNQQSASPTVTTTATEEDYQHHRHLMTTLDDDLSQVGSGDGPEAVPQLAEDDPNSFVGRARQRCQEAIEAENARVGSPWTTEQIHQHVDVHYRNLQLTHDPQNPLNASDLCSTASTTTFGTDADVFKKSLVPTSCCRLINLTDTAKRYLAEGQKCIPKCAPGQVCDAAFYNEINDMGIDQFFTSDPVNGPRSKLQAMTFVNSFGELQTSNQYFETVDGGECPCAPRNQSSHRVCALNPWDDSTVSGIVQKCSKSYDGFICLPITGTIEALRREQSPVVTARNYCPSKDFFEDIAESFQSFDCFMNFMERNTVFGVPTIVTVGRPPLDTNCVCQTWDISANDDNARIYENAGSATNVEARQRELDKKMQSVISGFKASQATNTHVFEINVLQRDITDASALQAALLSTAQTALLRNANTTLGSALSIFDTLRQVDAAVDETYKENNAILAEWKQQQAAVFVDSQNLLAVLNQTLQQEVLISEQTQRQVTDALRIVFDTSMLIEETYAVMESIMEGRELRGSLSSMIFQSLQTAFRQQKMKPATSDFDSIEQVFGTRPRAAIFDERDRSSIDDVQLTLFLSGDGRVHQYEVQLECGTVVKIGWSTLSVQPDRIPTILGPRGCNLKSLHANARDQCACVLRVAHYSCLPRTNFTTTNGSSLLREDERVANRIVRSLLSPSGLAGITFPQRLRIENPLRMNSTVYNRTGNANVTVFLQDQLCQPQTFRTHMPLRVLDNQEDAAVVLGDMCRATANVTGGIRTRTGSESALNAGVNDGNTTDVNVNSNNNATSANVTFGAFLTLSIGNGGALVRTGYTPNDCEFNGLVQRLSFGRLGNRHTWMSMMMKLMSQALETRLGSTYLMFLEDLIYGRWPRMGITIQKRSFGTPRSLQPPTDDAPIGLDPPDPQTAADRRALSIDTTRHALRLIQDALQFEGHNMTAALQQLHILAVPSPFSAQQSEEIANGTLFVVDFLSDTQIETIQQLPPNMTLSVLLRIPNANQTQQTYQSLVGGDPISETQFVYAKSSYTAMPVFEFDPVQTNRSIHVVFSFGNQTNTTTTTTTASSSSSSSGDLGRSNDTSHRLQNMINRALLSRELTSSQQLTSMDYSNLLTAPNRHVWIGYASCAFGPFDEPCPHPAFGLREFGSNPDNTDIYEHYFYDVRSQFHPHIRVGSPRSINSRIRYLNYHHLRLNRSQADIDGCRAFRSRARTERLNEFAAFNITISEPIRLRLDNQTTILVDAQTFACHASFFKPNNQNLTNQGERELAFDFLNQQPPMGVWVSRTSPPNLVFLPADGSAPDACGVFEHTRNGCPIPMFHIEQIQKQHGFDADEPQSPSVSYNAANVINPNLIRTPVIRSIIEFEEPSVQPLPIDATLQDSVITNSRLTNQTETFESSGRTMNPRSLFDLLQADQGISLRQAAAAAARQHFLKQQLGISSSSTTTAATDQENILINNTLLNSFVAPGAAPFTETDLLKILRPPVPTVTKRRRAMRLQSNKEAALHNDWSEIFKHFMVLLDEDLYDGEANPDRWSRFVLIPFNEMVTVSVTVPLFRSIQIHQFANPHDSCPSDLEMVADTSHSDFVLRIARPDIAANTNLTLVIDVHARNKTRLASSKGIDFASLVSDGSFALFADPTEFTSEAGGSNCLASSYGRHTLVLDSLDPSIVEFRIGNCSDLFAVFVYLSASGDECWSMFNTFDRFKTTDDQLASTRVEEIVETTDNRWILALTAIGFDFADLSNQARGSMLEIVDQGIAQFTRLSSLLTTGGGNIVAPPPGGNTTGLAVASVFANDTVAGIFANATQQLLLALNDSSSIRDAILRHLNDSWLQTASTTINDIPTTNDSRLQRILDFCRAQFNQRRDELLREGSRFANGSLSADLIALEAITSVIERVTAENVQRWSHLKDGAAIINNTVQFYNASLAAIATGSWDNLTEAGWECLAAGGAVIRDNPEVNDKIAKIIAARYEVFRVKEENNIVVWYNPFSWGNWIPGDDVLTKTLFNTGLWFVVFNVIFITVIFAKPCHCGSCKGCLDRMRLWMLNDYVKKPKKNSKGETINRQDSDDDEEQEEENDSMEDNRNTAMPRKPKPSDAGDFKRSTSSSSSTATRTSDKVNPRRGQEDEEEHVEEEEEEEGEEEEQEEDDENKSLLASKPSSSPPIAVAMEAPTSGARHAMAIKNLSRTTTDYLSQEEDAQDEEGDEEDEADDDEEEEEAEE